MLSPKFNQIVHATKPRTNTWVKRQGQIHSNTNKVMNAQLSKYRREHAESNQLHIKCNKAILSMVEDKCKKATKQYK